MKFYGLVPHFCGVPLIGPVVRAEALLVANPGLHGDGRGAKSQWFQ
jgi:hypothetical protein